ncbi:hypothetical protein A3860_24645 [Niastella vici]|uniref:Secreted protein n=1 Tax=Niastella vici TaxID=1703345 RepID=A0A1V9FYX2_9BACT|nr:hypothetical protein [Niastella vici]OQP63532.1 hypothetical protein A3860_24645 [Niastella vici]
MNKIKLAFIATAILAAVGGAFATRPCVQCEVGQQYYWNGTGYIATGEYGVDYLCGNGGVCTYYKPDPIGQPNYYAPCRTGGYAPQY